MGSTVEGGSEAYLELAIGPARDLDDHVEDGLLFVRIQRDVVERRAGLAIPLDVDAVFQRVRLAHLANGEVRHAGGIVGGGCEMLSKLLSSEEGRRASRYL